MRSQAILNCCGKKKIKDHFYYTKKPSGETDFGIKNYRRKFKKCKNCNHMYSFFDFNLKNLYNKKYSQNAYGSIDDIYLNFKKIISLPNKKSDNKNRIKRCLKYLNKSSKILDVGCGLGVFLFELKRKKFKIFGIEPDKNLFQHSKNVLGKNIFNNPLQEFNKKKKKYILILYQLIKF